MQSILFDKFYMKSNFAKVAEKIEFPAEEEKVLAYWKEIDSFRE